MINARIIFCSHNYKVFHNTFDSLKQGRSSSIGAKILSLVSMQLTDDFKEENTEKEFVQYRKLISYSE